RFVGWAALAVQAGGKDLRHRGLACPARADEQVGVVHLPAPHGVAQGAHHRLLALHLGERARAVAAIQRELLGLLRVLLRRHGRAECIHARGPPGSVPTRPETPPEGIACALVTASSMRLPARLGAVLAVVAGALLLRLASGVG